MEKKITFRTIEHSNAVENYINEHLVKIEEFLAHEREPIFIDIIIEPSKVHAHHRIEIRVKTADFNLITDFEGPEFYKVIDYTIDVMYRLLKEKKRHIIQDRKKGDSFHSA